MKKDTIHSSKEIYQKEFVTSLFDEMSQSYSRMNLITSFGFSQRWRKQCVNKLPIIKDGLVADFMTGMGESWEFTLQRMTGEKKLLALDYSDGMLQFAREKKQRKQLDQVEILKEDALESSLEDHSLDGLISTFGLKTFSENQVRSLADEVMRILKPGGSFSFIEVSSPEVPILRQLYMFYLKRVIPILGKLFLGNPENYRMLGIYTEAFGNSRKVFEIFREKGFEVTYVNYFYGCASGVFGYKKKL